MRSGEGRPWDVAQLRRADGWGGRVRRRMLPAVNQSNDGSAIYGCGRGGRGCSEVPTALFLFVGWQPRTR